MIRFIYKRVTINSIDTNFTLYDSIYRVSLIKIRNEILPWDTTILMS